MSADFDSSAPVDGRPRVDDLDADLVAAAEAVADGLWAPSASVAALDSGLLQQLNLINRVARVHATVLLDPPVGAGTPAARSSDSIADAMSRVPVATGRPDLSKARRWGPLFVLERVGGGAFGEVFRAWDPALDREVALKLLRFRENSGEADALVREGQLLASVRHPNVISVYGAAKIDGEVGIWMEFVRGKTLEQIVGDDGPVGVHEAVRITAALCDALEAIHKSGLLHRDIKASNVMQASDGRIVLLDFGTSTESNASSWNLGRMAGTPLYMAPEIFAGRVATPASDTYSLGVLTFFLVSGTYPVYGRTLDDLKKAHVAQQRVRLADVAPALPVPLVRAIEQASAANESARCGSAAEYRRLLFPDTPVDWRRTIRRRILTGGAALVGYAAVLTMLGIVNSRYFNVALARSDFADEGLLDWFNWGLVSSVAPTVLLIFALMIANLLLGLRRLLLRSSAMIARLDSTAMARVRGLRLHETSMQASLALAASTAVLVGAAWYFSPLLSSLTNIQPSLSMVSGEFLAFLNPANIPYHQTYRASFIWVVIACLFLWVPVWRKALRRGETLNRGVMVGGIAVTLLAVLLLDFPYRLLVHAEFPRATWRGHQCSVIGERQTDVLLFCPLLDVPRTRVVSATSGELERPGDGIHNVFAPLMTVPDPTRVTD